MTTPHTAPGGVYGERVTWRASRLGAERHVFIVATGVPGEIEKHRGEIDRLVGSMKAV